MKISLKYKTLSELLDELRVSVDELFEARVMRDCLAMRRDGVDEATIEGFIRANLEAMDDTHEHTVAAVTAEWHAGPSVH